MINLPVSFNFRPWGYFINKCVFYINLYILMPFFIYLNSKAIKA